MDAMLDGIDATLAAHESWSTAAREREAAAEAALLARARELAGQLAVQGAVRRSKASCGWRRAHRRR